MNTPTIEFPRSALAAGRRHGGHGGALHRDYARTPLNVYWEMTRACGLTCRHCRAEAMPTAAAGELGTADGIRLLDQIREFGEPLPQLILTGGDPLERSDLFEIVRTATAMGIAVSVTPAATEKLTRDVLVRLRDAGMAGLGLSCDGSTARLHDGLRGVPGTFARTLAAIEWAGELGIPVQVNTLISAETAPDLPAIFKLLAPLPLARWSLFFLIAVGRGRVLEPLEAPAAEELMAWIHEVAGRAPFIVATTEAPSFRRVAIGLMRAAGWSGERIAASPNSRGYGIRDGNGVVFVSHTGDICPAGFLPLAAGNVRTDRLATVYREAPLFRDLHNPDTFHGVCGECQYRQICGGSRARAFAATGNPFGSDPLCMKVFEDALPCPNACPDCTKSRGAGAGAARAGAAGCGGSGGGGCAGGAGGGKHHGLHLVWPIEARATSSGQEPT